jgi:hypothetical protein
MIDVTELARGFITAADELSIQLHNSQIAEA